MLSQTRIERCFDHPAMRSRCVPYKPLNAGKKATISCMSGADLADVVKARCKNARILLMSDHVEESLTGFPSDLRNFAVIKKLFGAGEIAEKVSEALELSPRKRRFHHAITCARIITVKT